MDKALLLLGVDRTKTREHKGNMAWISVQNTWDTVIQIHDILLAKKKKDPRHFVILLLSRHCGTQKHVNYEHSLWHF